MILIKFYSLVCLQLKFNLVESLGGGITGTLLDTSLVGLGVRGVHGLLHPHVNTLRGSLTSSLLDLRETLSDPLGGVHGLLSPHIDTLRGSLTGSLLDLRETLSDLLGGVDGLLDGDRVGGGGGTVDGGVGEAVDLASDSLEGLEVQGDIALSALEAPLVEKLAAGGDLLEGVDGLVTDITLGVGHFEC